MKTLYAVVFASLLLQACNDPSSTPTGAINISEHSTLDEYIAAASTGDVGYTAAVTVPAVKPFEGYWMDDPIASSIEIGIDGDEYNIGTVTDGKSADSNNELYLDWE
jgi:hypothetical protein